MADLEALLRSAQAAMTAASESAALKLRRPTRWRPPEQVLSAVAKTAIGVAGRLSGGSGRERLSNLQCARSLG